jgi:hypothetical protein
MVGFRESMTKGFEEQINKNPDVPDEIKKHSTEICDCIYYKIKANESLVDKAMTVPDPENFAMTSPEMKSIVEGCMIRILFITLIISICKFNISLQTYINKIKFEIKS